MQACPADNTKRSRPNQSGFAGLYRRCRCHSTYATGASAIAVPGWPESARCTASMARGRRRSRVWSQQTGFGGLPQADEPVEPAHQHVHLLRARAGLGGGPELIADARHFLAPLLRGFGGDLVQDDDDLLARRFVLRHLPQVIGELLAVGAELAEAVQERRLRAARSVGIVHCEVQLYPETGSEERLPGVRGAPS